MALITYDVSDKQPEVKAGMQALGYLDYWVKSDETIYLPNTTLWKKSTTPEQALADMKRVAASVRVKLLRAVAVPNAPSAEIEGEPHTE